MTTVENNNEMGMIGMFLYEAMKNYELFDRGVFRSILVPYVQEENRVAKIQLKKKNDWEKVDNLSRKLVKFENFFEKTERLYLISNESDEKSSIISLKTLEKKRLKVKKIEKQFDEEFHKYYDKHQSCPYKYYDNISYDKSKVIPNKYFRHIDSYDSMGKDVASDDDSGEN